MGRTIECICPICHAAIVAGVSIAWQGGAWVVTFYSAADGEFHVRCEDKDPLSINAVFF